MLVTSKYSLFLTVIVAIYPVAVKAENSSQNIESSLIVLNNKYSNLAYGNLERRDWIELYQTNYKCRQSDSCKLSRSEVQSILGFRGENTKTSSNGRIQDWIWIDSKRQNRQVKATFVDNYLTKLKGFGF